MALLCAIGLFVLAVNGDSIGDDADRFTLALTLQSSNDVDIGEDAFNQMFRDSPEHILKRECSSCGSTHRVIYYKRYTDLASFNLYRYTFDWESTNNLLGDDFNLFSTLEDALADTNPWTYCNYDDDQIGMFRDCGPTGYVAHEWTSRTRGGDAASFYIYTGIDTTAYTLKPGTDDVDDIDITLGASTVTHADHWYLAQDSYPNAWAIQMDLSGDLQFTSSVSSISVEIDGSKVVGQGDMFFGIGDGTKYISYLFDFDGALWGPNKVDEAIWSYPQCGGSLVDGDIASILLNAADFDPNPWWCPRDALAGGDRLNWGQFSSAFNGDTWPVTLTITNDVAADEVTFTHSSSSLEASCIFSGAFAVDSDVTVGILPDVDDGTDDDFEITSITVSATSKTATLTTHSDDVGTHSISNDGGASWTDIGTQSGWGAAFSYDLTGVSANTKIRVTVKDNRVIGGLIATVLFDGEQYSTTNPLQDGHWKLVSASDGDTSLIYKEKTSSPWGISTAEIASDAFWVWNEGTHNTLVFEFDFDSVFSSADVVSAGSSIQNVLFELSTSSEGGYVFELSTSTVRTLVAALCVVVTVVLAVILCRGRSEKRRYRAVDIFGSDTEPITEVEAAKLKGDEV